MASAVATRYAHALLDLVIEPASELNPNAAVQELKAFQSLLESSPELRNVLVSPAVPGARKRAVIARLAEEMPLAPLVKRFLYVIVDHGRTPIFGEIGEAFETLLLEHLGEVRADIAYALDLTPAQRDAIAAALSRTVGKKVRPEFRKDDGLIGGVVARVGSTVYDGSVRGQLEGLRERLVSAES